MHACMHQCPLACLKMVFLIKPTTQNYSYVQDKQVVFALTTIGKLILIGMKSNLVCN